jgi:hypothetical protein
MIGLPIDLRSEFPADAPTVLLTEYAAADPNIVSRIRERLVAGGNVVITTGLLRALADRGIRDIAEIEVTGRRALVEDFIAGRRDPIRGWKKILIPQVHYLTNDSWELVSAVDGPMGWPILHDADYAAGHLFVLTIPDNPADLYALPDAVLNRIRQVVMEDFFVRVDGPSEIALFAYDNDAFVVESFRDEASDIRIVTDVRISRIRDVETGEILDGASVEQGPDAGRRVFATGIGPHAFRAFAAE